ncbi:type II toxin-antitoxin system HipA family toxin [Variovorax defluvii]|uniref:Type II toxin-antitoxin system HipA family toxin n=1 Tax=Variovorax defluvii TaxID=913761 RepID=A0ABP8HRW4_9BURK
MSTLGIWMNGEPVGHWKVERGTSTLTYANEWLQSDKRRSLSLSLPITGARVIRGQVVDNYFDNLLPDNDKIRERLSRRFGTRDADAFSLLEAIGRDCVGAVQLLPEGMAPQGWDRIEAEPLSARDVRKLLDAVPSETPLGQGVDDETLFRISIAGAQEKTALTRVGKRWCRPHGATPTTHIFKLPLGLVGGSRRVDLSDSVENEWLCGQLLRELGLPVANTEMAEFDSRKVLIVERFDRAWMDGNTWIARLPQEDFCQALGRPAAKKYEKDGGPGMQACLKLLAGSSDAQEDRTTFVLTQLAFWLLAATDGHAKNFSIFLGAGDAYEMTPLYDVISVFPYVGDRADQFRWRTAGLAMALRSKNAHYALHTIQTRHWQALAMKNGGPAVWEAMQAMVQEAEAAIGRVEARLPGSFPEVTWERIANGVRSQARQFAVGLR